MADMPAVNSMVVLEGARGLIQVEYLQADGAIIPVPLAWLAAGAVRDMNGALVLGSDSGVIFTQ